MIDEFASGICELLSAGPQRVNGLEKLIVGVDVRDLKNKLERMRRDGVVYRSGSYFRLTPAPAANLINEIKTHPQLIEARIAECLIKHPGSTARDLAFSTGELVGKIVQHLKRMNHLDVVYYEQASHNRRYFLRSHFVFVLGIGGR